MTEWKEYTGSDEQVADIEILLNSGGCFITDPKSGIRWNKQSLPTRIIILKLLENTDKYLICEPHPLADMICQQARTGQPVWIRFVAQDINKMIGYETTKPDWNIPGAQYSFTPFEG